MSHIARQGPAILVAVVVVQFACSDTPGPSPTPAPSPATVTIEGHVRDGTTKQVVAGANVILRRPDGFNVSGVTDGAGYFSFTDVMTGEVTLIAALTAFDPDERRMTVTQNTTVELFIVPRRYMLSGRVTDIVTGAALAGADVAVLDGLNASRSTTTGADGRYTLPQLWFGGFTMRVRRDSYDSVFRGVNFSGDTEIDIQMRIAQQSLAGTWAGEMTFTSRVPLAISQATIAHSGSTITSNFPGATFTGTVADQSIGASADVSGTLTVRRTTGNPRDPVPCDGTGAFTGTVNWTRLIITAPQVTYSCGGTDSVTLSLTRQQ